MRTHKLTDSVERWTPAHEAVEMSDHEQLTILLDAGADPNEMCFGHTLLTHAIDVEGDGHLQTGHPLNTAATAILLAYGADPRLPAQYGKTPLQIAQYYNHMLAVRLLQRVLGAGARPAAQAEDRGEGAGREAT
ncbi:ankyrin repeat domain-containing protein [Streptomyces sp. NPDC058424]|uniref:ankyrin repeat domain-containing protein n=1 Tax=Streptomyces sp. NPDC058424 TaxID=3346491 RepID=UPI0036698341